MEIPVAVKRLKDVGHEIIPKLTLDVESTQLVDLPMNLIILSLAVMMVFLFVNNSTAGKRNPKPHFVNVVRRGSSVVAIGHSLRACTYLSTSVPGSSDHCLAGGNPERFRPSSLAECFYSIANPYHNCGDLMFSGHLLFTITVVLIINQYGESSFWISHRQNNWVVGVLTAFTLIQTLLILAARHHYTSDVVVAWYFTPLLWYYYNTVIHPRDLKPDLSQIARDVIGQVDL